MVASLPKRLTRQLKRLTDRIGLDFAAADYKTCANTGKLKFLEVNTAPMFVAFDRAGKGCITDAILRFLVPA
jgi:D-alanine-D-alanine ligase-like ATP-grasp enzyme